MLSDEEKKSIEQIKKDDEYYDILENIKKNKYNISNVEKLMKDTATGDYTEYEIAQSIVYLVNLIEKQFKEIEELKEDRKKYAEEYIHNNPWLYKQLNENYILRVESEQKERKAYIKGTNDADKLCNKNWKNKIKARIEKLEDMYNELPKNPKEHLHSKTEYLIVIGELQSLLKKE